MKSLLVVALIATLGACTSLARNVINEHGPYVENNHFTIEQDLAGNDIAVHILGGSVYDDIWRFEAFDDDTGAPGYINVIDLRPLRPVGPIRLWITPKSPHSYGAQHVKKIDLVTKKDHDTQIYGIFISGDLGELGDIHADTIRNVHVGGSLLNPMWTRDDISGYVTIGGNLGGDIYADSIPNLAVGGTGPHTGDITIRGSYGSTISLGGPMSGDIDIEGNHTGTIHIAGNYSGDATVDWGMTGTIDIDGNCTGSVTVADAMTGTLNVDGNCSGDITVNDDLTGTLTVGGNFTGGLAVAGDISAANPVHIGGDCGGHITATGDLNSELQIDGSLLNNPSYTYEIDIDGEIDDEAAVTVNWDAYYANSPTPDE
ncbi:MAG: hypothetical protein JXO22_07905 [Phycisphaerae bacterium]|nr:hypothetical protein [Phycisphaerae bacterium]